MSLQRVGSFDQPVHVAAPPDDHARMMVVEQGGTIRVVRRGSVRERPFLDITDRVRSGRERGLLSVAFPPDYATTRRFYVYYTDPEGDIRIEEYRRSASSRDVADPRTARTLLDIPHRDAGNHNGGQLQFGPDGFLYAGTGDGGGANDRFMNSQRLSSLLGQAAANRPAQRLAPLPIASHGATRSPPRRARCRRSGRTGCATPSGSRSTAAPATW